MFHFTLRMQYISLELLNQWYDVPQMAYLYNVIQQTGLKNLSWQEMDAFIEVHGEENVFIGGRPKDDTLIAKLATLVLTVAQGSAQASRQLGIQPAGGPRTGSMIVVSCEEVMEKFLKTIGDKACKELKAFCKNKRLSDMKGLQQRAQENAYWFSFEDVIDPAMLAAIQSGMVR